MAWTSAFPIRTRLLNTALHQLQYQRRAAVVTTTTTSRLFQFSRTSANNHQNHQCSRLFGSKVQPGNPPGAIVIFNDQTDLVVNEDRLRETIHQIRTRLNYPTYDICVMLVADDEMKSTNRESRGINKPSDILSFPFHEAVRPGLLQEPDFDIPDYYNLGDIFIDVPYVIRGCETDREYYNNKKLKSVEEEEEKEESDDRGVSGAMAQIYDPEQRINMLLVHGMLHLIGYDHEEDDEYEEMVQQEEKILKDLNMLPTINL